MMEKCFEKPRFEKDCLDEESITQKGPMRIVEHQEQNQKILAHLKKEKKW
jgi:hypothetical protein